MAKIAIVCDKYKLAEFEKELKAANIHYINKGELVKGVITLVCFSEQVLVKPIVDKVTQYFIDKYKKEN
jgi:hypothetical protein